MLNYDLAGFVRVCLQGQFYDVSNDDAQKAVFDLGAFVGDLTVEEDASGYILLSNFYIADKLNSHCQILASSYRILH